ncbi:odorant receptor Or2-like [Battus philenor]|uniref:odorant receptor Or2-like n=1 Tax=Battus philenor TaxID=42288 RepID=UPI0035D01EE5
MIFNFLINLSKKYEDPDHPLLGPNLKGLYAVGLLHNKNKYVRNMYKCLHLSGIIFVSTQFFDLYLNRKNYNKVFLNLSITGLSFVSHSKNICCIAMQSRITKLNQSISEEEIFALRSGNAIVVKLMNKYTTYVRAMTSFYWIVVLMTFIITVTSPFIKYAVHSSHVEAIKNDTESYPTILCSWFPFDDEKMPGYLLANLCHLFMTILGATGVGAFDTYACAITTFLKGQILILREKCRSVFEDDSENLTKHEFLMRIKECHRHHNKILWQHKIFNSIISPVMFIYVLFCSITICCNIVQLSLGKVSVVEQCFVMEYAVALLIQLFMFCWHSNEVTLASNVLDRGVYESSWWKGDVRERKLLLLLAGKMSRPLIMGAGPFTELSVSTFIDILRATYSFYALFTQLQDKR